MSGSGGDGKRDAAATQYDQLHALFDHARHLGGEERRAWLDERCGDAALRREVDDLLAAFEDDAGDAFSEQAIDSALEALEGLLPEPPTEVTRLPETLGGYRIVGLLGQGGMGVVYDALQESTQRRVALKLLHQERAPTPARLRRFQQEAELLGRLHHPGIAQIYEAGTFDLGRGEQPYFAMERVDGVELRQHAERAGLDVRARLELLARIADAVQHAHERGVIHRDLKPENLLVTQAGEPKVLDFGVARSAERDPSADALTLEGTVIGTLTYMAPEQLGGDSDLITIRADLYALGVVAYELLAGRLPYEVSDVPLHEAARVICESVPTPLGRLDPALRGDVEILVGKALEKEEQRRYASAADFAADLRRHLSSEPIAARPPTTIYTLTRFARRHRALVASGVVTTLALVVGLAGTLRFATLEAAQRAKAEDNLTRFQKVAGFQAELLRAIDPQRMAAGLRRSVVERTPQEQRAALEDALHGVNFTNVALDSLEESVFEGALDSLDTEFADDPLVRAELYESIGKTLGDIGLVREALEPTRSALALRREVQGSEHPDTLITLAVMGGLLSDYGQFTEAEESARVALDGLRRGLGDEHPETLRTMRFLSTLLQRQGRFDEAEDITREALERARAALGDDDIGTLEAASNLGSFHGAQGELALAEPYYKEALDGYRRVVGADHERTLTALENMGALLLHSDPAAAEPYLREALERARRSLGDTHPVTLGALCTLGVAHQNQGEGDEAEACYREALASARRALGDDHMATTVVLDRLGFLSMQQGRFAQAEHWVREALAGYRRAYGEEHPQSTRARLNLATLLEALGRPAEAQPHLRQVLRVASGPSGDRSVFLDVSERLARMLLALDGDPQEALELLQPVVTEQRRVHGDEHPKVGTLLGLRGRARVRLREFEEAQEDLEEAHAILFWEEGADSTETRTVTSALVELFVAWHSVDPSGGYDERAEEWRAEL